MSFEPQPANPFGWLIILLLGIVFFVFGFAAIPNQSAPPLPTDVPKIRSLPTAEGSGVMRPELPRNANLLGVESFDWTVRESFPPQVTLTVTGYWPDGCNAEAQINSYREGMTVYVQIYRVLPPGVMCTQMMQRVTIDVPITDVLTGGDGFRSGEYTLNVNGIEQQAAF